MPDGKPVRDLDHALERMVLHSTELLTDASIIKTESSGRHPGAYILELMSLEILLKAGALKKNGSSLPTGHSVLRLYRKQSSDFKRRVEEEFRDRQLEFYPETGAPLPRQLKVLGQNFVSFRYVYEAWLPYTAEERQEKEQEFVEGTLPGEDWDVVYYQSLVDILLRELLIELKNSRPQGVSVLPWEDSGPNGRG